jgi:hypothetical protein
MIGSELEGFTIRLLRHIKNHTERVLLWNWRDNDSGVGSAENFANGFKLGVTPFHNVGLSVWW